MPRCLMFDWFFLNKKKGGGIGFSSLLFHIFCV